MRRAWSRGVLCRAPHPNGKASMTESRHKDREQATAPTANREPEPELTAEESRTSTCRMTARMTSAPAGAPARGAFRAQ